MFFDRLKEKLFAACLAWRCHPSRLQKHLRESLPREPLDAKVDGSKIRAAALQVELKLFNDPLHYADDVHRRIKEAVASGAQLVAFPEYHNLPLFGMLPGIEKMEQKLAELRETKSDSGRSINLADLYFFMSPSVAPFIKALFSTLAKAYRIHIMAGSYPLAEKGRLVNRAFLFGPDGNLIGWQDKAHLFPMEIEWQLKRSSDFKHFDTPLGRLAMPVCMDATYYETFRIFEKRSVDIVLLPIANLEKYNYWLALRGIWPRVQESVLFGVKSALVGSVAGFTFSGRAGIFAPLELTAAKDGVLAEVDTFDREAMALADLDLQALRRLRANHPWRDNNPALKVKYPY